MLKIFKIDVIFTIMAQINRFDIKFLYDIERIKYSAILFNPKSGKITHFGCILDNLLANK